MVDYRLPDARRVYFDKLYEVNLRYGTMPGLVYLYLPALKYAKGWDEETCLWFAFLNGMTQNPLTSLRLFDQLPAPPADPAALARFTEWFNVEWPRLQYDTDRRYAKKETPLAIRSYCKLLRSEHVDPDAPDPQCYLYDADDGEWENLWELVTTSLHSFGRLSAFSYLEYVRIYGHGLDCADLMFEDRSGSRSHRNGMLFLEGLDHLVDDKRAANGFDGKYEDFGKMCSWLAARAVEYQTRFNTDHNAHVQASNFTFESQLCQFKNSFFGRRYPGVYADMAFERLTWYGKNVGADHNFKLITEIYASLPEWLRYADKDGLTIKQRAAIFPRTGVPYRAEHFLT